MGVSPFFRTVRKKNVRDLCKYPPSLHRGRIIALVEVGSNGTKFSGTVRDGTKRGDCNVSGIAE